MDNGFILFIFKHFSMGGFFLICTFLFIATIAYIIKDLKDINKNKEKKRHIVLIDDKELFVADVAMVIGVFFLSTAILSIFVAFNLFKTQNYENMILYSSVISIISLLISYKFHFYKNEGFKMFLVEVLIGMGISIVLIATLTYLSNGWVLSQELIESNFNSLSKTKDKELKEEFENFRITLLYFSGGLGFLFLTIGFLIRSYIVTNKNGIDN